MNRNRLYVKKLTDAHGRERAREAGGVDGGVGLGVWGLEPAYREMNSVT